MRHMIGHAAALRQFPSLRVQRSNLGRGSGSPEGAARWQGLGVSPSPQGASRGDRPLWQEVWRVSPRALLICPLPTRKGARGIVRRGRHPASSLRGACDVAIWGGVPPVGRGLGVSASPQGASRGDRPLWQEVWRVSLQSFTNFPLPTRKGARGMVRRGRHPASSLRGACDVAIWGGVRPVGRGLGVSASAQGASRGDRPLWQEV